MTPTPAERETLDAVIAAALERFTPGEGPVFTAAVLRGDEVLALSANEVSARCDASRHAEIVAIETASRALGTTKLGGCTLIASMQPCEMCLAAMRWAGIDRLVFAMTQELAPTFFQFPSLGIADYARACDHAFEWHGGHGADRLSQIYRGEA
ncbi:nucleoside deaminase [Salipiger sp.]|uniref:nucleoside deaminase n=1 Tax=Salipiger sp. TaxID=2078585 RepID=UPI003A96F3E5